MPPTALDDLLGLLKQVRRRWQAARVLRVTAAAAAAATAVLLLLLAMDRWLRPGDALMVAVLGAVLALAAAAAVRAAWRLRRLPDDGQVARYIEERCPALQDRLASAAEVIARGRPSAFRELLVRDAAHHARRVAARQVVPRRELRRPFAQLAAAAAVLLLALALGSGPLGRLGSTAWLYAFPHTAALHVEPGDARVPAGRPLRLAARLDAAAGVQPRTPPVVVMTDRAGAQQALEMVASGDGAYSLDIPAVRDSFAYRVRAASLASESYDVTALHPPRVERIDVAYRYPPAIGLAPEIEIDGGDVQAPPGTRVTITVRMSKPVEQAALARAAGGNTELAPAGSPRILAGSFEVLADDTYRIEALDADGLRNPAGSDYFIRTIRDTPPAVEILRPGGDREITPLEEVVVEARAEDDYGLRRFELVYGVPGRPERVVSLQPDAGAARAAGAHTIFAEELSLEPGRFITYHVRARDTGAAETRSDIYFLQVRPFAREFEEARSQDATGMPADELARLAELQKEIVVATWKLDGQPPAARAAADLETVADAQNDVSLAARVLASRLRPPAPAADAGPSGGAREVQAALAAAVESMAAAEAGLRAGRPGAAVPHEMAALDHLLRARDESGRTQVQPPASQAARGNGRGAQEDLSALFDRELRRDQRTSYESRPRGAEQSSEAEDDALRRRLQQLARRQEDLNRRQQELAEDAGERQAAGRLLQRLAREQEELRRQMEELGQKLERPGRQGAGRSPAARAARAAATEMRRAADELGRGDPSQAAARGRQALGGLRELGRSLGADPPRAGRRGRMGDLRLEAQQLAGLQRQLAAESDRAQEAPGSRQGNARRAARQDRLADRVDALAGRIDQARPGASGGERQALAGASRTLAEEDVARRMRDVAGEWRRAGAADDPAAGAGGARDAAARGADADLAGESPARLARALERVAGALAAAGDGPRADSGQPAAELEAARELRRRLAEIGQRPRGPAPARARAGRSEAGPASPGAGIDGVLEELARARPDLRPDLEQWARHWWSAAAPGTDPGRQDLSAWTSLYSELQVLLDEFEASRARSLAAGAAGERPGMDAGAPLPAPYRRLVDEYYRSLAERRPAR